MEQLVVTHVTHTQSTKFPKSSYGYMHTIYLIPELLCIYLKAKNRKKMEIKLQRSLQNPS